MTWTVNYTGRPDGSAIRRAFTEPVGGPAPKGSLLRRLADDLVDAYGLEEMDDAVVTINVTGFRIGGIRPEENTDALNLSLVVKRNGVPSATMHG